MSYTQAQPMLSALAANWWTFLFRGIAAVLFGLATFFPRSIEPAVALVVLFGAYALVDGILALVGGIRGSVGRMWPLLVEGVLGVLAGLFTFFGPVLEVTNLNLYLYVIAAWAILTGIFEVAMAISLRRESDAPFLMSFCGGLSMLFGLLVAAVA